MVLLFNAMDNNKREKNIKFFCHDLPCVRATQKHIHVHLSYVPSQRVKMDITKVRQKPIFIKSRYDVVW